MGRKRLDPSKLRKVMSVTLPQEVIEGLNSKARALAFEHDRRVTTSELMEILIRKYIMKEKK